MKKDVNHIKKVLDNGIVKKVEELRLRAARNEGRTQGTTVTWQLILKGVLASATVGAAVAALITAMLKGVGVM